MTITNTARRWALVGLLAIIAALIPLTGASAEHLDDGVTDLDATENVGAALAWTQDAAYPVEHIDTGNDTTSDDGPSRALIGRDDIFPDNLASGALQGADTESDDGPLLLTPTEDLDDRVRDELERLDVDGVTILGDEVAISAAVETELESLGYEVDRLGGITRIETAVEITEASGATTALLARGWDEDGGNTSQAYVDSLAAGAWAADEGYGVLLTQSDTLTGNTAAFLDGDQVDEVIIIGGEDAVSAEVEEAVRDRVDNVSRVGGGNRFATAVEIAAARGYTSDADVEGVILSEGASDNPEAPEGDTWADGLPAAHTSAIYDFPVLLTDDNRLPGETRAFIDVQDTDNDTAVICGPYVNTEPCDEFVETTESTVSSGVVVAADTANDTYTYVEDGDSTSADVVQTYDTDDDFIVDGEESDIAGFEAALSPGDAITVTIVTDAEGNTTTTHDLLNADSIESGIVTASDADESSYTFVAPGGPTEVTYDPVADAFFINGEEATGEEFGDALTTGDTVTMTTYSDGSVRHDLETVL